MQTIFKVFTEFVTMSLQFYFLCFCVCVCGEACGILTPSPGVEPTPLALKGGLTHWTTWEVPQNNHLVWMSSSFMDQRCGRNEETK